MVVTSGYFQFIYNKTSLNFKICEVYFLVIRNFKELKNEKNYTYFDDDGYSGTIVCRN